MRRMKSSQRKPKEAVKARSKASTPFVKITRREREYLDWESNGVTNREEFFIEIDNRLTRPTAPRISVRLRQKERHKYVFTRNTFGENDKDAVMANNTLFKYILI